MSFKPVKDRGSKRTSVTIDEFAGSHYGVGKTDQPKGFAYVSDLNHFEGKMSLRQGAIKNSDTGKSSSMQGIFNIRIGNSNRIGVVHGGVLDVQDINTVFVDPGLTWAQAEATKVWDEAGKVWV